MTTTTTTQPLTLCPFTVAVDHAERTGGYEFNAIPTRVKERHSLWIVPTSACHLVTGDYSIVGYEGLVAVERKSLEDLYGTVAKHVKQRSKNERAARKAARENPSRPAPMVELSTFEKELVRLNSLERAVVVVEADWREICRPSEFRPGWRSRLDSRSVWGCLFAWQERYQHIHWLAMGSRRYAELACFEVLERFWRERNE